MVLENDKKCSDNLVIDIQIIGLNYEKISSDNYQHFCPVYFVCDRTNYESNHI